MEEQQQKQTIFQKLKKFYGECVRVLTITKKPNKEEYMTIVKVSGLGIAIIGFVGFLITLLKQIIV